MADKIPSLPIQKVKTLPAAADLVPNVIYYVRSAENSNLIDLYLTGDKPADGSPIEVRHIINKGEIQDMINASIAGFTNIRMFLTIQERDAATASLKRNIMVVVKDATGDTTVSKGAATYFFDFEGGTGWQKISEYEGLDVKLTWESILNKPVSSVDDIDDAVKRKHSHANAAQLDKIGEDELGRMTYGGAPMYQPMMACEW